MSKVKKIADYILHPTKTVLRLAGMGYLPFISDERYLKLKFRQKMGYPLNLEHPRTFNEKLQWLKLHDRRPEYTTMVDKVAAKQWVADRIGEEHIIPTLGVWDDPDEIDFDALPDQFVLKCNHNSGLGMCICTDKSKLDIPRVKKELRKGLRQNYYLTGREWPYKDVPRKILAEQYMVDKSDVYDHKIIDLDKSLTDYKFFCFDGVPRVVYVSEDHAREPRTDFFDMHFNSLPIKMRDPNSDTKLEKPSDFDQMKKFAGILSEGIPHLRVDFYSVDGDVYVGELTFYHCSGFAPITPTEWNYKLGDWIELPDTGGYALITNAEILVFKGAPKNTAGISIEDGCLYLLCHTDVSPDKKDNGLTDYKIYCFNGEAKLLMVATDRFSVGNTKFDYFARNGKWLELVWGNPRSETEPKLDVDIEELFKFAEKLSTGIPHVRVDLYYVAGKICFGEMTLYDASGFAKFESDSWDEMLGEWIELGGGN